MKINSKKELDFVIQADRMMNRGYFKPSLRDTIRDFFFPDYIMQYLYAMRKVSYYKANANRGNRLKYIYYQKRYRALGLKLGFSIGCDTLGYGVVIPHYGTIVIGSSNRIGNYAVLHTSTCISDRGVQIGHGLYLATGVKITRKIKLGDNISIGANSLVNKSYEGNNALIGGMPAEYIKNSDAWYHRDGVAYSERVNRVEKLKFEADIVYI